MMTFVSMVVFSQASKNLLLPLTNINGTQRQIQPTMFSSRDGCYLHWRFQFLYPRVANYFGFLELILREIWMNGMCRFFVYICTAIKYKFDFIKICWTTNNLEFSKIFHLKQNWDRKICILLWPCFGTRDCKWGPNCQTISHRSSFHPSQKSLSPLIASCCSCSLHQWWLSGKLNTVWSIRCVLMLVS